MKIWSRMHKKKGFTLIEMLIVLIIMGILLMVTMALSGDQIQKIKNKAVKESILAQWQSRYSRNLGSSSFAGTIYDTMKVNLEKGSNQIDFLYIPRDDSETRRYKEFEFTDRFEIKYITTNYSGAANPQGMTGITLQYKPYQIYCHIGGDEERGVDNVVLIMRVNDNNDYCFEIKRQNCRLVEASEFMCNNLKNYLDAMGDIDY